MSFPEARPLTVYDLPIYVQQFIRLWIWLVALGVVFIPLERLFAARRQPILRKQFFTDLGYYFLNGMLVTLVLAVPFAAIATWARHLVPSSVQIWIAQLPFGVRVVLTMVVGEFGLYWGHRWTHEIPWLWRFHAVHHSAEYVDWIVNIRSHPVDMTFQRICGLIPLQILGLANPFGRSFDWIALTVIFAGTYWGYFIHANLKWRFGPLEYLIATPAFHHWHHTNDGPDYVDKNFAPMLPWMDWLFGTLYLPASYPQKYGIEEPVGEHIGTQLLRPLMFWRKGSAMPVEQYEAPADKP